MPSYHGDACKVQNQFDFTGLQAAALVLESAGSPMGIEAQPPTLIVTSPDCLEHHTCPPPIIRGLSGLPFSVCVSENLLMNFESNSKVQALVFDADCHITSVLGAPRVPTSHHQLLRTLFALGRYKYLLKTVLKTFEFTVYELLTSRILEVDV